MRNFMRNSKQQCRHLKHLETRSIPNMKYATPCLWDCLTCQSLGLYPLFASEKISPRGVRGRLRAPYMYSKNRCFLAVLVRCSASPGLLLSLRDIVDLWPFTVSCGLKFSYLLLLTYLSHFSLPLSFCSHYRLLDHIRVTSYGNQIKTCFS